MHTSNKGYILYTQNQTTMKNTDETKYPIYIFSFTWIEDGKNDGDRWNKKLPDNRIHNYTSFRKMFKTRQKRASNIAYAMNWWTKYIYEESRFTGQKLIDKKPELTQVNIKFLEYETWVIGWFSHETFDVGQTNQEALISFGKFVDRKHRLGEDKYCLMGAEDRWRWHGLEPTGDHESNSPAPCRCKHCKESGVIRIAH